MRPARQGDLDALCGIYAVINALDPAGLPLRRSPLHKALFLELTYGLGATALLGAMDYGLEASDIVRAARHAFDWLKVEHGVRMTIEQPLEDEEFGSVQAFAQYLEETTSKPRMGVIISFARTNGAHCSVVRKVSAGHIVLRDSWGIKSLDLERFSLDRGPHRLRPSDTLVIRRVGSQGKLRRS